MDTSNVVKYYVTLVIGVTVFLSSSSAMADLFGPAPIAGHCSSDKSAFDGLVNQYGYTLIQTSEARNGRTVMYYKAEDFMIAVADEERSKWCVQFTGYDAQEFVKFLVGRYDPTTHGDEGTD